MAHAEVMGLPLKTFWLMVSNIDRIMARDDLRSMNVAMTAQAEAANVSAYQQKLIVEAGTIVKLEHVSPLEEKRDESGFADLKVMAGQNIG